MQGLCTLPVPQIPAEEDAATMRATKRRGGSKSGKLRCCTCAMQRNKLTLQWPRNLKMNVRGGN